jgi:uncharacterized membrane protein
MTFGARHNALVLIAFAAAGVGIRAWFVARHKAHERGGRTSAVPLAFGLAALAGAAVGLAPRTTNFTSALTSANPQERFARVQSIVEARCVACHAAKPTFAGFTEAPKGVLLDTPEHILAHTPAMQVQLSTRVMPIANITQMTDSERAEVLAWLADGAPH